MLTDLDSCQLADNEKALFRFLDRVNQSSPTIQACDLEALRAKGWTDEAIYYAITVCALFNFYNRWIDASGVHPLSDEAHRRGGERSASSGYARE